MPKLLKDLWSFTMMVLIILGIGGLVFNFIRDGGWLHKMFGAVVDVEQRRPAFLIPMGVFSIWVGWLALNGKLVARKTGVGFNLIVWGLALYGVYVGVDWLRNFN